MSPYRIAWRPDPPPRKRNVVATAMIVLAVALPWMADVMIAVWQGHRIEVLEAKVAAARSADVESTRSLREVEDACSDCGCGEGSPTLEAQLEAAKRLQAELVQAQLMQAQGCSDPHPHVSTAHASERPRSTCAAGDPLCSEIPGDRSRPDPAR